MNDHGVVQGILLAELLPLNDLLLSSSLAIRRHAVQENALAHLRDVSDARDTLDRAFSDEAGELLHSVHG
eukprot:CAMPEP_0170481648 /NCGR_PEP_ID=MMETSP0208-20121228/2014_1 /TAXON_ID=197538 /ORGANISM="Strombidium inclinatum, Strain S3" /LENGTH=69 /DNA_ID=CAMNT_0010754395 /DNA_START=406 /DNA_END=615 /DNA_ORIENTATION=-